MHPSTSSSMSLVQNIQHNNNDLHSQHVPSTSNSSLHHQNNVLLGQQRENLENVSIININVLSN